MKCEAIDGNVVVTEYDDNVSKKATNALVGEFNRMWGWRTINARSYACDYRVDGELHRATIKVRKTDKPNKVFSRFLEEIQNQQVDKPDLSNVHIGGIVGLL